VQQAKEVLRHKDRERILAKLYEIIKYNWLGSLKLNFYISFFFLFYPALLLGCWCWPASGP
jgi:hypothetical protein